MKRTTIYIDNELHDRVRLYCVTHNCSLSYLINSLLLQCLSINNNDFIDFNEQ